MVQSAGTPIHDAEKIDMLRPQLLVVAAVALTAICSGCTSNNVQDGAAAQAQQTGKVGAKHILLKYQGLPDTPAHIARTDEEAKALIEEILEKLEQGEKFEDLAMDHSDCPSAAKGGDLGRFGPGQMVGPFEEAAFACEVGGTTDIVETRFGYHIIYRYE